MNYKVCLYTIFLFLSIFIFSGVNFEKIMKYFEADDIKKQKPQKASITQLLLEKNSFLFNPKVLKISFK